MTRRGDRVQPNDDVLVFDHNGTRVGQPVDGWRGLIVSKGPKWVKVEYDGARKGTENFDYDGRAHGGFRHFELPAEYAERKRNSRARKELRERYGVYVQDFHQNMPGTAELEKVLELLDSASAGKATES